MNKKAEELARLIGTRVRELREARGLTQGDVEKLTGIERSNLSRIENGVHCQSLEIIHRLAGALEVRAQDIVSAIDSDAVRPSSAA